MDEVFSYSTISTSHHILAIAGSNCSNICVGGTQDWSFQHAVAANSASSSIVSNTAVYFVTYTGFMGSDGFSSIPRPQRPALSYEIRHFNMS